MPDSVRAREREKDRETERTQHQLQTFPGHVAAAKLLTSDWPLEETGLTAPPTLHCPIPTRSIAWPSIMEPTSSSFLLFPVFRISFQ